MLSQLLGFSQVRIGFDLIFPCFFYLLLDPFLCSFCCSRMCFGQTFFCAKLPLLFLLPFFAQPAGGSTLLTHQLPNASIRTHLLLLGAQLCKLCVIGTPSFFHLQEALRHVPLIQYLHLSRGRGIY